MPRLSLKVLRKPVSRCNNSSPRYMRENHYAVSCSIDEFLRFSNYKISITLLIFLKKMSWIDCCLSNRKVNENILDSKKYASSLYIKSGREMSC